MSIINKIKLMASLTRRESKKVLGITKTNIKISAIEEQILNLYIKMGKIYFENHVKGKYVIPGCDYLVNEIIEKQRYISKLKHKIDEIKNPAGDYFIIEDKSKDSVSPHCSDVEYSDKRYSIDNQNFSPEEIHSGVFFHNIGESIRQEKQSPRSEYNSVRKKDDKSHPSRSRKHTSAKPTINKNIENHQKFKDKPLSDEEN